LREGEREREIKREREKEGGGGIDKEKRQIWERYEKIQSISSEHAVSFFVVP
jgi:hypothetical protein